TPEDEALFGPRMPETPFHHIALNVDAETQQAIERRLAEAGITEPRTYVLEHGYCRSVYVTDPNGLIRASRRSTARAARARTPNCAAGWRATTPPTTPIAERAVPPTSGEPLC